MQRGPKAGGATAPPRASEKSHPIDVKVLYTIPGRDHPCNVVYKAMASSNETAFALASRWWRAHARDNGIDVPIDAELKSLRI